jgi:hypothetical protein
MWNCDDKDEDLDQMQDRIEKVSQGHGQGVVSVLSHTVSSHMPSCWCQQAKEEGVHV